MLITSKCTDQQLSLSTYLPKILSMPSDAECIIVYDWYYYTVPFEHKRDDNWMNMFNEKVH